MDTQSDFKYWPYDDIPTISERVLAKLEEYNEYERDWDTFGERSLRLLILNKCILIPRFLTSKGALVFLGFNRTRVKQIWHNQIRLPEPMDEPDIENGGEHLFWTYIVQFLDDNISSAREYENNSTASSQDLLDRVGLTREVQRQELRITDADGLTILTSLQAQLPKDAVPLAKQYIKHRWAMLVGLEDIIDKRVDFREDIVAKFTRHPIEIMIV